MYQHNDTAQVWQTIAPFWPLKNLIAVNPLQGFEGLSFEKALGEGASYFQQATIPLPMEAVNRETIKWLQPFIDDGQATISMPLKEKGLYKAWRQMSRHDKRLIGKNPERLDWLKNLPEAAEDAIASCLSLLQIPQESSGKFLTLLLTTLPGWAAHIKYHTEWSQHSGSSSYSISRDDYLAFRLALTYLLWPQAKLLLEWHEKKPSSESVQNTLLEQIEKAERRFRVPLVKSLQTQHVEKSREPAAQYIFCIDVRSEPFRRALEAVGDYQTFGFAGFFGVPARIQNSVTDKSAASFPVLLSAKHEVEESPCCAKRPHGWYRKRHKRLSAIKRLYQSVKYNFTTPFALVDGIGIASGAWMLLRTLFPIRASKIRSALVHSIVEPHTLVPSIDAISLSEQCQYAKTALQMIGLCDTFAPIVVFCGHGSTTTNNAFASALDCGACGGNHGASSARIAAAIFNNPKVRMSLCKEGIVIPEDTQFIAAQHDTTTDAVQLFSDKPFDGLLQIKKDLEEARRAASSKRLQKMTSSISHDKAYKKTVRCSQDWAEVRPEWGLARNAAFIIGPRSITKSIDLDGRCFLHSYEYSIDAEGALLTGILTAPMVVAQWINTQYLFSTLDNIAYGSGSKITKNITGKIGVMQGNASDLMTGLPFQSVYVADGKPYHEVQRLMTVVYAPQEMLTRIVANQPQLQKLFGNGWVQLACLDPHDHNVFMLERDFTWKKVV